MGHVSEIYRRTRTRSPTEAAATERPGAGPYAGGRSLRLFPPAPELPRSRWRRPPPLAGAGITRPKLDSDPGPGDSSRIRVNDGHSDDS